MPILHFCIYLTVKMSSSNLNDRRANSFEDRNAIYSFVFRKSLIKTRELLLLTMIVSLYAGNS